MNKLTPIIVVILLFCGGSLWFLASGSLNDFIKTQIETIGSQTTEQQVKVNNVDIKMSSGAGAIKGLTLANPAKYNASHLFSLGQIGLDINLESLTKEPIVIDEILIEQPEVFVEFKKDGSVNVKEIMDAIKKNIPASNDQASQPTTKEEPKISVTKLTVAGVKLSIDLSDLGNKVHQATLPDIELSNIGGQQGLPASQLGVEITQMILDKIWRHTKKVQKDKLKTTIKEKAKEKLGDLLNKIGG